MRILLAYNTLHIVLQETRRDWWLIFSKNVNILTVPKTVSIMVNKLTFV